MSNLIIENIMSKIKNNQEQIVFDLVLTRNNKYLIFLDEVFERGGKNLGSIWDNTFIFNELISEKIGLLNEEEQYIANHFTFTKSTFIHFLTKQNINENFIIDNMVNYIMSNVISGLRWLRRNAYTNVGMVVDIVASFISLKGNAAVWGILVLLGIYEIATNNFDPKDPERKENPYLSLIFDSIALVFTAGPALFAKKAIQGGIKTLSKSPKTVQMLTEMFKKFPGVKRVLKQVGDALGKKLKNKGLISKMLSFIDTVLFKILTYFKKMFSVKMLKVTGGAIVTVAAFNGLFMALDAAISYFGGGGTTNRDTDNVSSSGTPMTDDDKIVDAAYLDSIISEHTILNEQAGQKGKKLISYLINKGGRQVVVKVSTNVKAEFISNLKKAINEVSKSKNITNIKNASSELKNNPNFKMALGRLAEDISQNTFNKSYKKLSPAEKNLISDNVNKIIKQESDNILSKAITGRTTNLINKGKGAQVNVDDVLARLNKLQSGARTITKTEAKELIKIIQGLPPLATKSAPTSKNFFVRIGGRFKQFTITQWRKLFPKSKKVKTITVPNTTWNKLKSMGIWKSGVMIATAIGALYFIIFGTDSDPTTPTVIENDDNKGDSKPFKPCQDFPFMPGCTHYKLREMRVKIDLSDNAAYDKALHDALVALGYDLKDGITEEIYNQIMNGKNPVKDREDNFIDVTPQPAQPEPSPSGGDVAPQPVQPDVPHSGGDDLTPIDTSNDVINPEPATNKNKIRKIKYKKDGTIRKEKYFK